MRSDQLLRELTKPSRQAIGLGIEDLTGKKCNQDNRLACLPTGSCQLQAMPGFKPMLRFLLNRHLVLARGLRDGAWLVAGLVWLARVTVVGLPWARACFVIGKFVVWHSATRRSAEANFTAAA